MSHCGHVKFGVLDVAVYIQLLHFMYEKTLNNEILIDNTSIEISFIRFSLL
jgi:hypothetical protein